MRRLLHLPTASAGGAWLFSLPPSVQPSASRRAAGDSSPAGSLAPYHFISLRYAPAL